MGSPTPWSIKGIDAEARKVAKAAAQAEGMTLGAWMTQRIIALGEETSGGEDAPETPRAAPAKKRRSEQEASAGADKLNDETARRIETALSTIDQRFDALSKRLDALGEAALEKEPSADATPDADASRAIAERAAALVVEAMERRRQEAEAKPAESANGGDVGALVAEALTPIAERFETAIEETRTARSATEAALDGLAEQIDGAVGRHDEMSMAVGGAVAALAQRLDAVENALSTQSPTDAPARPSSNAVGPTVARLGPARRGREGHDGQDDAPRADEPEHAGEIDPADASTIAPRAVAFEDVTLEETTLEPREAPAEETDQETADADPERVDDAEAWDGEERRQHPTVPNVDDPKAPARRQEDLMAVRKKMRAAMHGPIDTGAKFGAQGVSAPARKPSADADADAAAAAEPPQPAVAKIEAKQAAADPVPSAAPKAASGAAPGATLGASPSAVQNAALGEAHGAAAVALKIEPAPSEETLDAAFVERETTVEDRDGPPPRPPARDASRDTGEELNRLADRLLKRTHLSDTGDSFVYAEDIGPTPRPTTPETDASAAIGSARATPDEARPRRSRTPGRRGGRADRAAKPQPSPRTEPDPLSEWSFDAELESDAVAAGADAGLGGRTGGKASKDGVARTFVDASHEDAADDGRRTSPDADPIEDVDIWDDIDEVPAARRSRATTLFAIGASALVMSFAIVYVSRLIG